ncbi:unnamed protein product [Linum tenue]|uniref:Uncharacterized protein n=1 Tax=Linum tenue TaxID=586396 RepID=A0AAV0QAZ3_9ROSI|nr:unnamed protein product [Linum tenue]
MQGICPRFQLCWHVGKRPDHAMKTEEKKQSKFFAMDETETEDGILLQNLVISEVPAADNSD